LRNRLLRGEAPDGSYAPNALVRNSGGNQPAMSSGEELHCRRRTRASPAAGGVQELSPLRLKTANIIQQVSGHEDCATLRISFNKYGDWKSRRI